MKRLSLFLVACITGWWGYRQLRNHPRTADNIADLERHSRRIVEHAGDSVRSAKDQAVGRAADVAGAAAAGAQEAIDTAAGKAHGALDAAAQKTREAISPVRQKISEMRPDESAAVIDPALEHPAR